MTTRLHLKEGVSLDGLTVEGVRILEAALLAWEMHGYRNVTVTAGTDGRHAAADSGHTVDYDGDEYYGHALDLRTFDLPGGYTGTAAHKIVVTLRVLLGPGYDVVLEETHIHVECDKRIYRGGVVN